MQIARLEDYSKRFLFLEKKQGGVVETFFVSSSPLYTIAQLASLDVSRVKAFCCRFSLLFLILQYGTPRDTKEVFFFFFFSFSIPIRDYLTSTRDFEIVS